MHSIFFYYQLFKNHEIIHKDYAQITIVKFENIKFPKFMSISKENKDRLIKNFEIFHKKTDNFLLEQLLNPSAGRYDLDYLWIDVLGYSYKFNYTVKDDFYGWLQQYLKYR